VGEVTPYPGALETLSPSVPLTKSHDTSRFDCGKQPLNDWLKFRALKSEGQSARCYVLCARNSVVVGYYCLSTGAVQYEGAPRKIRRNMPDPIPVMIIGRMGIDRAYQGQGLGRALLKDALFRIIRASKVVGARVVLVHAVDQEAVPFYARYNFRSLPRNNQTLFLPIDEIIAALPGE
jgi:GNAT superfamily N-acetyltransferase